MDKQMNDPLVTKDEVSLRVYAKLLWNDKWLLIAVTMLFASVTTATAFLLPKSYQATITLSPVAASSAGSGSGLSAAASQFGGLAALAGINISSDSKKAESVAVLQSEILTEAYIKQENLLPALFPDKWDSARGAWKPMPRSDVPTLWKANRLFEKQIRKVSTNAKTGLVLLTITWNDAQVAAKWANELATMTNAYLRGKALQESERNIEYLNSEAAKTSVVEARQAIFSILRNELDKAMVARGSEEYSFKVIDPAFVPEKPSSPQKLVWIASGLIGGFIIAVLVAFLRDKEGVLA